MDPIYMKAMALFKLMELIGDLGPTPTHLTLINHAIQNYVDIERSDARGNGYDLGYEAGRDDGWQEGWEANWDSARP